MAMEGIITGPRNGPVLFCCLSSVAVVCRRLYRCQREGRPAAGRVDGRRAGGRAADTARRASTVTSR